MRLSLAVLILAATTSTAALAGNQSSNISSNSSSNNGVTRERVVDTYCGDRHCERWVHRRVYRDDWRNDRYRDDRWRRYARSDSRHNHDDD